MYPRTPHRTAPHHTNPRHPPCPTIVAAYGVSRWPLFVAYTAEPETSAVGAAWDVFYGYLARVLGEGGHAASASPDNGDGNNAEGGDGKGGRERGWSSLSDPFFTSSPTLSSFYAAVADKYYHLEPTVYRVNFELTDAQVPHAPPPPPPHTHTHYLGPYLVSI